MKSFEKISLAGNLLVAMPQMDDPRFERSVILMLNHQQDGAMGIIVNQQTDDLTLGAILINSDPNLNIDQIADMPVYLGGPVDTMQGFILHTNEWSGEKTFTLPNSQLNLTQSLDILDDCARGKGPKLMRIIMGYAGWSSGQLEDEIQKNLWLVIPNALELIFNTEDDALYEAATKAIGIDIHKLSSSGGDA